MQVGRAAAVAAVAGMLAAGCGSGSSRLNNAGTLASTIKGSVQHTLDSGTGGLPAGTKVTGVGCVNTRRLDFTCDVHLDKGGDRSLQVTVAPGGRSYVVTSGDL